MRPFQTCAALGSILCLLGALAQPLAASQEIYHYTDEDGTPVFSDRPPEGRGERVELRAPNLLEVTPTREARRAAPNRERSPAPPDYRVQITQPAHEEGVRAPDGQVAVQVAVEPAMAAGHRIELLLNGEPLDQQAANGGFTIETFVRGENVLVARILDGDRELARSDEVRFYLLRRSLLHPGPARPAPNYPRPQGG